MGSKRLLTATIGVLIAVTPVFAQLEERLQEVDELIDEERPEAALDELESMLAGTSGAERAEVLWRTASAHVMLGDQREDAGADDQELLQIFEQGEEYGEQAIQADPSNHLGYYWKSANIGRWGQTRGVLNSLFRAPEMRDLLTEAVTRNPEHADSYFVLGQLYAQVPGMISFGNTEYAVSLARKSVDLMEEELQADERDEINESFYIQLASHLIDRGWNRRRRNRAMDDLAEAYRDADSAIERGFFYEGHVSVPDMSDEDEARDILEETIDRIEAKSSPSPSDRRQLEEARELLNSL